MKKFMCVSCVLFVCNLLMFQLSAQDPVQDRIELGREGGTTRLAGSNRMMMTMSTASVTAAPATAEAFVSNEVITISVQNYRGPAWVEIIGRGGFRQSYFQVFDMGFEVLNIAELGKGRYMIRITLGDTVYKGTYYKRN